MKSCIVFFFLFLLFVNYTNVFSEDVIAPSVWGVQADKVGVDGRFIINVNNDLPLSRQPLLQGWVGSRKIKKDIFQLSVSGLITSSQKINFKEYLENYKKTHKALDPDAPIILEKYDFIKLNPNNLGLVIDVKDFEGNVIVSKWNGENVYIEIPTSQSKSFDFKFNNLFGDPAKNDEIQKMLSSLPDLQTFIKEMQSCAKKKDKDCLLGKVALDKDVNERNKQQGKIGNNFIRKFILDDPKAYEIYKKTRDRDNEFDNHIPDGIEKKIDYSKSNLWLTLQEAFELDLKSTFINFESDSVANGINTVIFFRKLKDGLSVSRNSTLELRMILVKTKKGWSIENLELTSFDDDYM